MLTHYLLFLAKTATVVLALLILAGGVIYLSRKGARQRGPRIQVTDLRAQYRRNGVLVEQHRLDKASAKAAAKARKRREKEEAADMGDCTFVLDFKGDLRASAVTNLRDEVSAILDAARPGDRVLVRLDSGGGMVNAYGLAAAQLLRLREAQLQLIVLVDQVAASGGYLMAVTAHEIVASPFALVGSIGVVAQIPNFHRWLRERHIDFEQFTAGKYKRTVTLFGENTDAGRQKLREELEDIHSLFRHFVAEYRPQLDLERVATGEAWLGIRAKELGLVDRLATSDAVIQEAARRGRVLAVHAQGPGSWTQRLGLRAQQAWDGLIGTGNHLPS
ncbi:protease SohB [Acidithiobacillus sp.]|uniref:protease SohB n=1 Tax=Acidithiobacillus sp. TaxID=1872118 RepID=UPI0025B89781|nr:protease SohB [Acidithiobacillus sp.]